MTWSKVKWIIYTSTKKCVLGQITDEIIWYYFISIKQTLRMLWHSECAAAQVSVPVVTFLVCCSGAFNISKVSLLTWNSSLVSLQPTCNISTLIYPFIWSCLDILVEEFSKLMQDIACLQCVCVFISIGLKWFLKVCCHMTISRLKSLSIKCLVTGDLLLQQIRSD